MNVLPQRGWIQSVVNGTDPDSDLKIWSNAIPSTNAADIVEMANCKLYDEMFRSENSSTTQKIYSTLLNTFLILGVFLI